MMVYAWEEEGIIYLTKDKHPFCEVQIDIDERLFMANKALEDVFWPMQDYLQDLYHTEVARYRAASILAAGEKQ